MRAEEWCVLPQFQVVDQERPTERALNQPGSGMNIRHKTYAAGVRYIRPS